jgi:hypothetical protein
VDVNTQPAADYPMLIRRMVICLVASSILSVFSLVLAGADLGAMLCFGIALISGLLLFAFGVTNKGRQRLVALFVVAAYLVAQILVLSHYSLVRDHARWLFLSGRYKAHVLAQPTDDQLKHVEWDGWGFPGAGDTTVFLVFDPTDSLAVTSGALPPVRARGLPCEVVRVRRLDQKWYAVLFYTDTYWGQSGCK